MKKPLWKPNKNQVANATLVKFKKYINDKFNKKLVTIMTFIIGQLKIKRFLGIHIYFHKLEGQLSKEFRF